MADGIAPDAPPLFARPGAAPPEPPDAAATPGRPAGFERGSSAASSVLVIALGSESLAQAHDNMTVVAQQ
jgi:hypothetical protein